jgi:D-threo-aldose 1-dehydrogenase
VLAGQSTYDYAAVPEKVLKRVRELDAVCRAHDVELPRAALQFVLAHPIVVSVIPGGQSHQEVEQNAAMLTRPIPAALWRDLKAKGLVNPKAPTPDGA